MRAVIDKYSAIPFTWGADCCTFVGECVEALTGHNPNFAYSTHAEAKKILARFGSLEAAITDRLGGPYFGYRNGYVALVESAGGIPLAGIFYRGRIVVRVQTGLMDLPPCRALRVWRTW